MQSWEEITRIKSDYTDEFGLHGLQRITRMVRFRNLKMKEFGG